MYVDFGFSIMNLNLHGFLTQAMLTPNNELTITVAIIDSFQL